MTVGAGYLLWQRSMQPQPQAIVQQIEHHRPSPEPQSGSVPRSRSNATAANRDIGENDDSRSRPHRFENLADPARSDPEVVALKQITTKTLRVDLSLENSHWESPLDVPHPTPALTLVGIDSSQGFSLNIEPASGALTTDTLVTVGFVQFSGFQLRLRLRKPDDVTCRLVGDWRLTLPTGEIPFSWVRVQRQERFFEKKLNAAQQEVRSAETEKQELLQFINSFKIKRLDAVGQAKNRVQQIDTALTVLKANVANAAAQLNSFRKSVRNVQELEENATLLIRYQSDLPQMHRAAGNPQSG